MKKNIFYLFVLAMASVAMTSCNDFLDEMPDSRAELNTEDKIVSLLVSAYPTRSYPYIAELTSDNVDDYGVTKGYNQLADEIFNWTESSAAYGNEYPMRVWEANYLAIAAANQAISAINDMGGPNTTKLRAAMGEALVSRAYNHWVQVTLFSMPYNPNHPDDLGVPYMDAAETELNPRYERGTVMGVYEKIVKDLEEGIPMINDVIYSVPKYHFNYKAACCFASRVYLFMQDYDNAIKYANMALGSDPESQLHDWDLLATYPRNPLNDIGKAYCATSMKANYLVMAPLSNMGVTFSNYGTTGSNRFTHGKAVATRETSYISTASLSPLGSWSRWKMQSWNYGSGQYLQPRCPYLFEYTDPVQGIGYTRTTFVLLSGDEALLNRAEAYIMKKDYDSALADMNLWIKNCVKPTYYESAKLTVDKVNKWAEGVPYSTPEAGTPKKELNPYFEIEPGTQENMIHTILFMRRFEFLHMGMRWFDVRRYGITIHRRLIDQDAVTVIKVLDTMTDEGGNRDPRRCLQLPPDVIAAGLTPNPR